MDTPVVIDAHRSGGTVWIDWFLVPDGLCRRSGHGRAAYRAWEAALPPDVTLVRLFAADAGTGRSDGFWDAMGFSFVYDAEDDSALDTESRWSMVKGVNGHPTPAPLWVSVEDAA